MDDEEEEVKTSLWSKNKTMNAENPRKTVVVESGSEQKSRKSAA